MNSSVTTRIRSVRQVFYLSTIYVLHHHYIIKFCPQPTFLPPPLPNSIWNSSHLATPKPVSTSKYYQESSIVILDVGTLKYRSFRYWFLKSANGRKTGFGAFFLGFWLFMGFFVCLLLFFGWFFVVVILRILIQQENVNNFICITAV